MKQVGVLALQGAFIEHEKMLEQLGVSCIELRNIRWNHPPWR